MAGLLTPRREAILKIIVKEYIDKAAPVASETVTRSYRLGVSPATVRNDMAYLEKEGYVVRPHVSAGAVPMNQAYRYYVEALVEDTELPPEEKQFINGLLLGTENQAEEWARATAALLARLVRNVAVVTVPKATLCRFKRLELISLQEFAVLLVLVLYQTKLKRQVLTLSQPATQEDLNLLARNLNLAYDNLTESEIKNNKAVNTPLSETVTNILAELMVKEDRADYEEAYLEGMRLMLGQPEFTDSNRMLGIMDLLERRRWLTRLLPDKLGEGRVEVIIGEAGSNEELPLDLSLIFSGYGVPNEASGAIGVIGPTRMDYGRAISSVRYLSGLLTGLVTQAYQ